ncbi:uncharacterized protein LACBIDRAFT_294541 [Laccaria bicolor S238N-H82]|uniref:Predicted protein n=1 Tax=Laccaria bicolor (strain S238N-H82 / ATCC MYA-4686) TaxID=486041 RepID=B0DDF2_LACBS|nr:uncharacterized protein LACBIDRAFT_327978 [Laccaria bicolor S238N-H82]XP_001881859.1 uncharacterized protein LACBIDRAFT_294541 [Laccaria bicolor S238N-H82]EDR07465.1 predicted protein [Laccaria bicolor S238N-H82]EDR07467.1 predicted protein [Laccaria bicolor S238N-H82]|eukprot:XP_001881857.1 predicted protein [Laccaria bicolor S238N-H82]
MSHRRETLPTTPSPGRRTRSLTQAEHERATQSVEARPVASRARTNMQSAPLTPPRTVHQYSTAHNHLRLRALATPIPSSNLPPSTPEPSEALPTNISPGCRIRLWLAWVGYESATRSSEAGSEQASASRVTTNAHCVPLTPPRTVRQYSAAHNRLRLGALALPDSSSDFPPSVSESSLASPAPSSDSVPSMSEFLQLTGVFSSPTNIPAQAAPQESDHQKLQRLSVQFAQGSWRTHLCQYDMPTFQFPLLRQIFLDYAASTLFVAIASAERLPIRYSHVFSVLLGLFYPTKNTSMIAMPFRRA